jgi:hypothetical protein
LKEKLNSAHAENQNLLQDLKKKEKRIVDLEATVNGGPATPSLNNAQDRYKKLLSNYRKLRETDGDLTLEFPDNNSLKAQKSILKAHSSKLAEDLSENSTETIKISDIKFEVMKQVLVFLYSGELDFSAEDAADLLDVSQKFKIPVLKEFLLEHVDGNLNVGNFLAFYVAAKEEGFEEAKEKALKFFGE